MELAQEIIKLLKNGSELSSAQIHGAIGATGSVKTTRRAIDKLVSKLLIDKSGTFRNARYSLGRSYSILHSIDADEYLDQDIDERDINTRFNFGLIRKDLYEVDIFTETELVKLIELQEKFRLNISDLDPTLYNKEMERLAIDLSWKSSQIEGNTYTLLETEQLLKEKKTASGRTKDEAVMLLNHKEAIDFIVEHPDYMDRLTMRKIEDLHFILTKELGINRNLRSRQIGITGTNYRPPDNEFQIKEAFRAMCDLINHKENVFDKALIALVLISYIQGFMDGNKRTARIVSNAVLLANGYCPLSFRTISSLDYKKAMLVFYERNNITAFKRIFTEQFAFAVRTYF